MNRLPTPHAEPRVGSTLSRFPTSGEEPSILAGIFTESVNIAVWRRALTEQLRTEVSDLVSRFPSLALSRTVSPEHVQQDIRASLGVAEDNLLSRDIAFLAEMFCDLLDVRRVGLRLSVLNSAMCPKFHVDRVACRLITSYQGIGTEWLPHDAVDRSKLGLGSGGLPDHESGLYRSARHIERLAVGDVAIMKGELWENNEGAGLVHRSPSISNDTPRLMLSLDVAR